MGDNPIAILTASRSHDPEPGRPHLWPLILVALMLMAAAVIYFGGRQSMPVANPTPSGTADREARVYTVSYRFGVFSPTNLRIHAGDTVRFRNDSSTLIRIVAQLQPGEHAPEFDSVGDIQPGSYFSYTFSRVGVFVYINNADERQTGVIIVR